MESSTPARRQLMQRVRTKNTAPELLVRRALHSRGLRYRVHRKDLPGKPDLALAGARLAVFVHGCFWHGCPECDRGRRRPKANAEFWAAKLNENRLRDARQHDALLAAGWRVATVWECAARDPERLAVEVVAIERTVRGTPP